MGIRIVKSINCIGKSFALYYQCRNPWIIVRLHDQGASMIHNLKSRNIEFKMCWIPGHAGIAANEIADKAAKKAARESLRCRDNVDSSLKSIQEIKSKLQKSSNLVWQRQWNIQDTGRDTFEIMPKVPTKITSFRDTANVKRSEEAKLNRLRSGTHMLKSHKMRSSIDKRAGLSGDKICPCGKAIQDVKV